MKKLLPFIIIILVAILGIVVAISLNNDKVPTNANNISNNKGKEQEEIKNDLNNAEVNKIQEPSEEIQNEIENEEKNTVEESENNEQEKTDEEKAIDLVKKTWGEDSNVNFAYDGKNAEGKYIISVRDKNTTRALEWYIVDLENETCKPR